MKRQKGFTLVELLAVIVILAVLMIIAIPAVLNIVNKAKKKTFDEMAQKVYLAAEQKYILLSGFGELIKPGGYDTIEYLFDIEKDLDIPSTGNIKGVVLFDVQMTKYKLKEEPSGDFYIFDPGDIDIVIYLYDDSYIGSYHYSKKFGNSNYVRDQVPEEKADIDASGDLTKEGIVQANLNYYEKYRRDWCPVDYVFVDVGTNSIMGECHPRKNYKWPV